MPLNQDASSGLEADPKRGPHRQHAVNRGLGLEIRAKAVGRRKQARGKGIGLSFLSLVPRIAAPFAHVCLAAAESVRCREDVTLEQEVPQLVGDAEARPVSATPIIDQDAAGTPNRVGEKHAFAAIERGDLHLVDVERLRDLDDRDRPIEMPDLIMDRRRKPLRSVNIRKLDSIKVQVDASPPVSRNDLTMVSIRSRSRSDRCLRSR